MADERPIEQPTSQELFSQAVAPPLPVAPEPTPPSAAPAAPVQGELPLGQPPQPPEGVGIPSWRLKEESDARRAAEERIRELEGHLQRVAAHLQAQQPQQKPDFFQNPDQATQEMILRTLAPYAEEQHKVSMYNSKMIASAVHGAEEVDKAEEAFLKAREEQTLDVADYERVVQSPNRYDAAVQWYRRQNVYAAVGDDPNAWFEQQLEARMADPKFQATVLEKIRGGAATRPGTVSIPPSLSKVTAAAGNGEFTGDLSDPSLWAYAMGPKR